MLLSSYIKLVNEANQHSGMIDVLHRAGANWLRKNNIYVNSSGPSDKNSAYWNTSKHQAELFRFYFPSDNDNSNKEVLDGLMKAMSDNTGYEVSVYNGDYSSKINGRNNGTSSKYFSYTIYIKNKETGENSSKPGDTHRIMFICNTNNGKDVFASKDLTPNKLLNLNSKNSYSKVDDLISDVNRSLDSHFSDEKYASAVALIKEIMLIMSDRSNYQLSGLAATATSVDDFFYKTNPGKAVIDLLNKRESKNIDDMGELLAAQSKSTIACIEKDFGEILGPIMFMTIFDNATVTFPVASNNALVDYFINGHKVSAKQEGGGGKPAGTSIFANLTPTLINGSEKVQQKLMNNVTAETDKMKEKEEDAAYNEAEQEFIRSVASTYSKSCCEQQVELIMKFLLYNKELKKVFKDYQPAIKDELFTDEQVKIFSSIKNIKETELVDKIVGDDPKSFFETLFAKINFTPNRHMNVNYQQLDKAEWDKLNYKYGALVYPLWKTTISIINSIYTDEKICGLDVVTSIINKQIDMKQVYFGIRQNKGKLECIASKAATWRFDTGGISANNITNARLSIKMIH